MDTPPNYGIDVKPKDHRDAEAHESSLVATKWHMEGEKLWCLHRALALNEKSESASNLGLNPDPFWDEQQVKALKDLYYKKLLAL